MKKLLTLILVLCASISGAQIVNTEGSFIAAGGTLSGCSIYSFVYVDVNGNLACALTPVNGSVSTAGRSILTIRDTITGSSATSNFLNITGAFPATLSARSSAFKLSVAGDNDGQIQVGTDITMTGTGPSSSASYGVYSENQTTGTYSTGVVGHASAAAAVSTGVIGIANAGTNRIGGFFSLANENPPFTDAALVINNGTVAANIFEARDNGTAVLTVANGGATTFESKVSFGTGGYLDIGANGAGYGAVFNFAAATPDSASILAGSTSNSVHILERADSGFDLNNGRCGTSACTSPALIIHSPDQVTTEYAQISTDTSGAAGFQSNFAEIRVGGTKTAITEGSAQAIVRFGIPTSTNVFGATVYYTVYDINGANYTSRTGQVRVQGGNSSGTATCTINIAQDTEAEDGSQIATSNAATLTYTWTNVVSTTNCDLSLNATSSQGTNTVAITWTAVVTGNSSAITVVGQ